ncbi:hypothetical protein HYH03_009160 [Edaphochlamys debaryana]|uniref:Uncharacterized protein n=1 Tax=Edaphochlamys debaryana TaxID=47281 RepID=A0A835XYV6_9CHLO|nr:hypothetical protein HYH03_009160 [Edaphochlamys debaryana]|eukprot:KAG2492495.1 hypothetical protein HYH03_009160 [Edaphochlamys debaryana]
MDSYAALDAAKRESPAAERNKGHIAEVLLEYLSGEAQDAAVAAAREAGRERPLILEVASGSGQHAAHLAAALPAYDWQPTDLTPELFPSIAAYAATGGPDGGPLPNLRLPPLQLDASDPSWPERLAAAVGRPDAAAQGGAAETGAEGAGPGPGAPAPLGAAALFVANMCHISPLEATKGLIAGAGRALRPGGGLLAIYGPFTVEGGTFTSPSNQAFDASLRTRDPSWGYRDLTDLEAWGRQAGLDLVAVREMPANNFMVLLRRR